MYPHCIRLRGPWEAAGCDGLGNAFTTRIDISTGQIPEHWRLPIQLTRHFGKPRNLDEWERVWLASNLPVHAQILLNDQHLGEGSGPTCFDVTRFISDRNQVRLQFTTKESLNLNLIDARLEIRCETYLDGLTLRRLSEGSFSVSGRVFGATQDRMDLFVLVAGKSAAFRQVFSSPNGCPFEVFGGVEVLNQSVQVDLLEGANVLWRQELPRFLA